MPSPQTSLILYLGSGAGFLRFSVTSLNVCSSYRIPLPRPYSQKSNWFLGCRWQCCAAKTSVPRDLSGVPRGLLMSTNTIFGKRPSHSTGAKKANCKVLSPAQASARPSRRRTSSEPQFALWRGPGLRGVAMSRGVIRAGYRGC